MEEVVGDLVALSPVLDVSDRLRACAMSLKEPVLLPHHPHLLFDVLLLVLLLLLHPLLVGGLVFGHLQQLLLFFDLEGSRLHGLRGENSQNGLYFLLEVEQLVLLYLGRCIDACLFGPVGRRGGTLLELVSLYLNGDFRGRLSVGIFEEEVKVWLYFGVWRGFDVVRRHFLLVFAEIG